MAAILAGARVVNWEGAVQLLSWKLCVGDYVQVYPDRFGATAHPRDEGFVRIERIEHLPRKKVEGIVADALVAFGPVATLWCHGVPGPIVMRGTDVRTLRDVSPGRVEHETSTPWWPQSDEVLLRDAVVTRSEPRVDVPQSEDSVIDYESAGAVSQRARPPATWFGKPAVGLLVGDYVGVHRNRWPESDREADEGFVRVEHLRVLDPHIAQAVFADPSWHTTVIVAHLHGLHGVLVLRGDDEVPVLAFVNPEREAWDRRGPWEHEVTFSLRGSRWSTEEEHQHAVHIDAAHRPSVDESALYPSSYDNEFSRRMGMESLTGFRSMPLAALPWPHHQAGCPLGQLADDYQRTPHAFAPQTAHAAASISPEGAQIRDECPYHRPDWPKLVRIFDEAVAAVEHGDSPLVRMHPDYESLSEDEQRWLHTLVSEPITYDDGGDVLVNGQHRLCALRFAGVTACPIYGSYLPDTDYGPPASAEDTARAQIAANRPRRIGEPPRPRSWFARFLPPFWRRRRRADR